MAIRVHVDSTYGQIERNWYSAGSYQFTSPETHVYGHLKLHDNEVFALTILCLIDTYEVNILLLT